MSGADDDPAFMAAWTKAYSDAQAPRPKLREMIDSIENVVVQKTASARVIAREFNAGIFSKEALRDAAVLDAAQELLKRILANVSRWGDKEQAIIRGDPPKEKVRK